MSILKRIISAAIISTLVLTTAVFAQEWDTAYVPVTVNVDAVVTIQPQESWSSAAYALPVSAGERVTFTILFDASASSISHGRQRPRPAAGVRYGRGAVLITLPARDYGSGANVTLYSVDGKRILSDRVAASNGSLNVSRKKLAPGVYLLSVRSAEGNSFSTKLTHSGGRLNINAAFTNDNDVNRAVGTTADAASWKITAEPAWSGYRPAEGGFDPVKGQNPEIAMTMQLAAHEAGWTPTAAAFAIVEKSTTAIENSDVQNVNATNVAVSWNLRPNAVRYEVYRNGRLLRQTSGNLMEDYGLTIGRVCEYVVAGYTSSNVRTLSAPIRITPFAASADPGTWRYMNRNASGGSSEVTVTASTGSSNPSGVRGADNRWYQFRVTGGSDVRTFQYRRSNDGRTGWSAWTDLPSSPSGSGALTVGSWVGDLNGTQTTINPAAFVRSGTMWNGAAGQTGVNLEGVHWYQVHDRGLRIGQFQEGKYVLGCHREPTGNYNLAHIMLVSCYPNNGQPYGEITYSGRPFGFESRDQRIFVDNDGTAYAMCSALGDSHLFKLDPEWREPVEHTKRLFEGAFRETPDILRYGDWYFHFSSRQSGWYPSQVQYAMTQTLSGTWSALQEFGNVVTFGAQFNGIRTDRYGDGKTAYGFYSYRWSNNWHSIAREDNGNPRRFTILNIHGDYASAHWFNNIVYYPAHGYVGIRPGRNLSLGKNVTAPSAQSQANLQAVTDGMETASAPHYQNNAAPYDLIIDLERASVIREITVATRVVNGSESPCQYTISGSTNGRDYTQLIDASGNGQPGFVTHDVTSTSAYRYIKLTVLRYINVHNNNNTLSWADGVYEVSVYGD